MMHIHPGIIAIDLFLYLEKHHVFVLSDIHIGYGESLRKQGMHIPLSGEQELRVRAERAIHALKKANHPIKEIVINGDINHSFSKISRAEKDAVHAFITFLQSFAPVHLIKGNHDKVLDFIVTQKTHAYLTYGDVCITHGDVLISAADSKDVKTIIIGHEHPSVGITKGARTERYKCFLKGPRGRKTLIVSPSCNLATEGSDILREKVLSPYIRDVRAFRAFIIEDIIYDFGTVKDLLKILDRQNSRN